MKFTVSTSLKRAGAGAALSIALLSATGCGYIYTQPTTLHYAASDGVHGTINNIELRNIMVVSHGKGAQGRLLGTILNKSDQDTAVTFNFTSGAKTVNVLKGQEVRLEQDGNKLMVAHVQPIPGQTLSGTKVSAGNASDTLNIPVMDGTLKEYNPYLPAPAETSASTAPVTHSPSVSTRPEGEPTPTPAETAPGAGESTEEAPTPGAANTPRGIPLPTTTTVAQ